MRKYPECIVITSIMITMKHLINALLLGTLVSFLVFSGCTSAGRYTGTYTCVDDPSSVIILNPDGTVKFSNGAGNFTGTYSLENTNLKICANNNEGSNACVLTQIGANGSFPMGFTTYRK